MRLLLKSKVYNNGHLKTKIGKISLFNSHPGNFNTCIEGRILKFKIYLKSFKNFMFFSTKQNYLQIYSLLTEFSKD